MIALGVAGLLLGGAAVGSIASGDRDLSKNGGAARLSGDQTKVVKKAIDGSRPDNVILLIGDGMGDSEITSARNYVRGAAGRFPGLDNLPLTGQYTTYSLTKDGRPDYVPDSAATGTAWATGTKSYDGAIGVDVKGKPQKNLLELAKKAGYKTGNVSTAELQDATPAVLHSHVSKRGCYGPEATTAQCPENAKENGGLGSITEQLIDTRADVTLGGGAKTFAEIAKAGKWKGLALRQQAENRGYQIVEDLNSLQKVKKADQDKPVLGLFAQGNFPVRWTGPAATPDGGTKAPVACTENPAQIGRAHV